MRYPWGPKDSSVASFEMQNCFWRVRFLPSVPSGSNIWLSLHLLTTAHTFASSAEGNCSSSPRATGENSPMHTMMVPPVCAGHLACWPDLPSGASALVEAWGLKTNSKQPPKFLKKPLTVQGAVEPRHAVRLQHQFWMDWPTRSPSTWQQHSHHTKGQLLPSPTCLKPGNRIFNCSSPSLKGPPWEWGTKTLLSLIYAALPGNEMVFPIMGYNWGCWELSCQALDMKESLLEDRWISITTPSSLLRLESEIWAARHSQAWFLQWPVWDSEIFCSVLQLPQDLDKESQGFPLGCTSIQQHGQQRKTNKLRSVLSKGEGQSVYRNTEQFCRALFKSIYWNFPRALLM